MDSSPPMSLRESLRQALLRREAKSSRRRLTVLPQSSVDFSSNDFLSLSTSPVFRDRFLDLIQQAPPLYPFASGGSRLLDGNSTYAEELENFIADFHSAPSGLLFNSGFDANVGVFSCIPQPGDLIVYDELVHASAREGMRLSRAGKRVPFSHSSPSSLDEVLQSHIAADPLIQTGSRNVFIAIESIYSMDGDVAPIQDFIRVVDRLLPRGNGYFIVDEAHATGVFGPRGAGVIQGLGVEKRMFIRVHTFGKALASHGAIVLCCPDTRDYLINYARSLIYTTAMGFPFLASIRAAYELLAEGETEQHQTKLQQLVAYFRDRLAELDAWDPAAFQVDHFPTSPIFSVRSRFPRQLAAACQQKGFVVRAIMAPTVPAGRERVRVCLHAGNTVEEIDGLVDTFKSCSSCYKPTCPGAESCQTLYEISDLVVAYAQQSEMISPPVNAPTPAPPTQIPTEQAPADASDSDNDGKINWKKKLAIEATECVFRGVHLSAPPFPFRQRWDVRARHEIGERKNRGRKRKRREYEEYDDEEYKYFDNEDFQRMYESIAATLATVAAAHTSAQPTKRRKKAMKKKKQGRVGNDVAGPGAAGSSA
ncbi:8-amino-7-oxononanoate synthase [Aspergillus lentulus]|uniref:8-amino-7-oxononanoate synthase n=1 Tax=Aspergillus lentulus TaxID=293939 RepID=A0AAN4T7E7_ASPLE|nr:8-amino-7-oxononanoate synthase [Aspergillus lentulus]